MFKTKELGDEPGGYAPMARTRHLNTHKRSYSDEYLNSKKASLSEGDQQFHTLIL